MATKGSYKLRVLMFSWLAYGHLSPYLELAKKLAKRNIYIYLCSSPINLASIKQQLGNTGSTSIELVELHLPTLPNLPPHYHTTNSLPLRLMQTLNIAFDMSKFSFATILQTIKPDLLIYDFLQLWAPEVAMTLHIPAVHFQTMSATAASYLIHITKYPDAKYPFPEIFTSPHEDKKIFQMLDLAANDISNKDRFMKSFERSSDFILMKTNRDIEGKYIEYLSSLIEKEVLPLGTLVQESMKDTKKDEELDMFMEWLNKKKKSSTVFVSFGSEYFIAKEEIQEIAYGLELSRVNFIWVIRFPKGEDEIDINEVLPEGFVDRVGEKGLTVQGWAPQEKILRHESIGGFVSHCGWSSVLEAMKFGVPIIAMPMQIDQPVNAKLIVEIGVGVEVRRDYEGGFNREDLKNVISDVVFDKDESVARKRMKEVQAKMVSKDEVDVAVEKFLALCRKT